MAGTDPLAAISARVAAAEAAMLEAAINLGVSAEVLQAQIGLGDILAAKILPPENGQDFIEILGQRVAAQLPPGVHPGETLLLQVTAFSGTQIFVRNLGTPDPANPVPVNTAAVLTASRAQSAQPQSSVSPPRAVFVAASVRQAPPSQTPPLQSASPAVQQVAAAVRSVEARIAAAQAAKPPPVPAKVQPTTALPLIPVRIAAQSAPLQNAAAAVVQRAVQTVSEFLRSARLPDTPFTRMAATIAPHAPERVPSVLQRLEAALPRVSQDARIPTLRTLIAFTARLNPSNAETLRTQIASYVSNVVQGVEAKLSQLLQAHAQASAPGQAAARAQTAAAGPQGGELQADEPQAGAPALSSAAAQARVAERSAAISHDLKSVVLSLLRDPPPERTPAMSQALSETLITLTGAQVNALSSNQQNPGSFTLTLPVYYREGGKPAQIRISRDAESRAPKMDADNFHIGFVLDTGNLGTVAVDLQTSGRTVKVDVKTERAGAAARFSDTLGSLRARLEDLRYRVSSAAASAIPSGAKSGGAGKSAAAAAAHEKQRGLDLRA